MWWAARARSRSRQFALHLQQYQSRNISIFKKYRGLTLGTKHPSYYINLDRRQMPQQTLGFHDGPLVWIDCEMTGLDPRKDKLLEIAVIITNGNLQPVDVGIEHIIRTEKSVLDGMTPWCVKQHGESGLTKACLESPDTLEAVSKSVLEYVKKWIPTEKVGVLAGNSVHCDKAFLVEEMPDLVDWLHYRLVDVSSIKELSRRWYGRDGISPKPMETSHRALDDIRGSIKELQWYRDHIFVKSNATSQQAPSSNEPASAEVPHVPQTPETTTRSTQAALR